jgi:hypothetical protein
VWISLRQLNKQQRKKQQITELFGPCCVPLALRAFLWALPGCTSHIPIVEDKTARLASFSNRKVNPHNRPTALSCSQVSGRRCGDANQTADNPVFVIEMERSDSVPKIEATTQMRDGSKKTVHLSNEFFHMDSHDTAERFRKALTHLSARFVRKDTIA